MTDERLLISRLKDPRTREQAFTLLIQQYQETLYMVIRGILKSHADTDDALQNTFIKAWGAIEGFRGESRLSTWLYSIARNEAMSFLSKKARTINAQEEESTALNRIESDPYMDGEETERMLHQAIEQLPDKQRTVFMLRYFQETPYEEMSEMTGTSVGALKASYHLAVKKITAFFQQHD
ncbi:MAG: RNA polymerase sigma factor [Bacteroidaceae bacterium]